MFLKKDVLLFSHVVLICHIHRQHLHRASGHSFLLGQRVRDSLSAKITTGVETPYNDKNIHFKAAVPNIFGCLNLAVTPGHS